MLRFLFRFLGTLPIGILISTVTISHSAYAQKANVELRLWVGSWAAAPSNDPTPLQTPTFAGRTLRQVVRLSIGGVALRIRFTNEFGTQPLKIDAARVATSAGTDGILPASDHAVTFSGQTSVTILPGAYILSDPVGMEVEPLAVLAISVFLPPQQISSPTAHPTSFQTTYLSEGNMLSATSLTTPSRVNSWYFLKGVDVQTKTENEAAVVTLGDSITDGFSSTLNANRRWPDDLAERLHAGTKRLAVLNEGISGNRVLHDGAGQSALARFDRDVLAQAGVKYLILLEGINDIGQLARPNNPEGHITAEDLEHGLDQLVRRAHEHGIKVFGATLTPYKGSPFYTTEGEETREVLNGWIRNSHVFDGTVDFAKAIEDPADPTRILATYDDGKHIHPNDAGYKAMSDAVELELFR